MKVITEEAVESIRCYQTEHSSSQFGSPSHNAMSLNTIGNGSCRSSPSIINRKHQRLTNVENRSDGGGIWSFHDNKWHLTFDDGEEVNLLYSKQEVLPLQDFDGEVRPTIDVEQFLEQCVLLLDDEAAQTSTPVDLVDLLLGKMDLPVAVVEEAKTILVTHDIVPSLAKTIQATYSTRDNVNIFDYDESWLCTMGDIPSLAQRRIAIMRLKHPTNMGETCHDVQLFVLILCPGKEKGTKNGLETSRTFATLLADVNLRRQLLEVTNEEEFKELVLKRAKELVIVQQQSRSSVHIKVDSLQSINETSCNKVKKFCQFGQGIREDLCRRLPHYLSDYVDGIIGPKTPQKVMSTTFFLYFACLLPAIAFGVLNDHNTNGKIGVRKVIVGQTIGGLFFAFFGGQPLLIMLTTAPLALYIKVISSICDDFELDFYAMYGCVGLWCAFFLLLFSLFNVSRLMCWCTRSTEEIFGLFISIAFCVDAFRDTAKNFQKNYSSPQCRNDNIGDVERNVNSTLTYYLLNQTQNGHHDVIATDEPVECNQATSVLFLFLMLGTVWVGVFIFNFKKTPFLSTGKREALADYALPIAVLTMSFVGSFLFQDVKAEPFRYDDSDSVFTVTPLERLSGLAIAGAMGLGFALSLLILMDQNISSAMVNTPLNNLKKGPAYHWDLFVMAILTAALSAVGLPWMHALVPHSPLHARALADVEERVHQGHVYQIIVRVRETRLTVLFSHILIGLSILLLPYPLAYIPPAVLNGLFLYVAITGLGGNQMFERIMLFFTEQSAYPPNHYIRRVPQRKIHQFTGCQLAQLLLMCLFGFVPWPYMKMVFPVILLSLLPIRHLVVPRLIERRFLKALDSSEH
ncbi:sodium bicarbonate transporter-like protein 11 isoform X2 [Daphnia magna]|uniref:sodium bicarbonate transporter-like protein 11 isoform X2 n=1 Tax=Daphnia magna TaxID=35525 RepID=UPI001E1BB7E3|nr:sodium bicarbonate transporter-like protein 11 isoform X2 [Daphnia magna]